VLLCLGGDRDRLVTVTLVAPPQRLDVLQRSLAQMLRSFRLF
jgi:hypothetical protein